MAAVRSAPSCRSARRSVRAIPCWSASAGFRTNMSSLPGLTRQSIASKKLLSLMDARVKPAHDDLFQMLLEKLAGARPRDFGAGLVVACAFLAIETVLRPGIDVDLD